VGFGNVLDASKIRVGLMPNEELGLLDLLNPVTRVIFLPRGMEEGYI
jgi:hypothetical protein